MDNKKPANKYMALLILLNLVLVAIFFFVFFDFESGRLAEVNSLSDKIYALRSAEQSSSAVDRLIKDSAAERDRLNLYFITKETAPDFIAELESAAAQSGTSATIDSLSVVRDDKLPGKQSYLSVGLQADGAFPQVFHYLTVLENMPYKTRWNAVSLVKNENQGAGGHWSLAASFDLLSYINK